MLSNKLTKQPMKQEVYNHLLQAIIKGQLEPGKQLDEKEISESLGVSRTPLREAINRLAQEGIVREIPYRGNFVRKFTAKEVVDLYEVRKTLEVMAIRLAVIRMAPQDAEELAGLVRQTAEAQEAGDMEAYAKLDTDFHDKIAECSGNQVLNQMLNSMSTQIKMIRHIANSSNKVVKKAQFDREQILSAIATRDAEAAGRFMEEHIQHVMEEVIHQMNETS
jgi:DNA-binding GntR family transcriptional regulator